MRELLLQTRFNPILLGEARAVEHARVAHPTQTLVVQDVLESAAQARPFYQVRVQLGVLMLLTEESPRRSGRGESVERHRLLAFGAFDTAALGVCDHSCLFVSLAVGRWVPRDSVPGLCHTTSPVRASFVPHIHHLWQPVLVTEDPRLDPREIEAGAGCIAAGSLALLINHVDHVLGFMYNTKPTFVKTLFVEAGDDGATIVFAGTFSNQDHGLVVFVFAAVFANA